MGTSAFILKEQEKYTPEKLLADAIVAAFHADLMLYFHNYKHFKEGRFTYTTLNILDHSYLDNDENDKQFIFYVKSKYSPSIFFNNYDDLGLDPNRKLGRVGTIEEIYGAQEVIFRFIYEYLKLNPNDYFWVADYDWVYRWEDMQKLKSLPYDPDWCYKDPKFVSS